MEGIREVKTEISVEKASKGAVPVKSQALALSFPPLAFPVTFTTELLGAVLLLISTGVIAWKVWQESIAGAGQ